MIFLEFEIRFVTSNHSNDGVGLIPADLISKNEFN